MALSKIGIITRSYQNASKHDSDKLLLSRIVDRLRTLGHQVDIINNGDLAFTEHHASPGWNAILSMSRSISVLNLLLAWERIGTVIINPPQAVLNILNRPLLFATLRSASINIPPTYWCKGNELRHDPNWLIKSINKSFNSVLSNRIQSHRWYLIQSRQEYIKDVKLYVVGDRIIIHSDSSCSDHEKATLHAIGAKCKATLGLDLLSIDVLIGGDSFSVVDVNDFPSYSPIGDAAALISDLVIHKSMSSIQALQ